MPAPEKKIDQLRTMMAAGDWRGALRLAAKFPRLGTHKDAIERGWAALTRPEFYRELGRDPDALVLAGVDALRAHYAPNPESQPTR